MDKRQILERLALSILNHQDSGSIKIIQNLGTTSEIQDALAYECMIIKLYLFTSHVGNRPREGTPLIIAEAAAHAVANMLGGSPEGWKEKILSDVESYLRSIPSGEETLISKLMEAAAGACGGEMLRIDMTILHNCEAALDEMDNFMKGLTLETYKNLAQVEHGSANKAAASSGCLIPILGLLLVMVLGCILF